MTSPVITEISEEVEAASSGTPTVVVVSGTGSSISVSPAISSSITSVASDGSLATLEVVATPAPTTVVDSPSQVVVQASGLAIPVEGGTVQPFVWRQTTPIGSIVIAHALGGFLDGGYPQVDVVDSATMQRISLFGCTFPTADTAQLTFLQPRTFIATFSV